MPKPRQVVTYCFIEADAENRHKKGKIKINKVRNFTFYFAYID